MNKFLQIILISIISLTVISCKSSDDSSSTNDLMTGTFKSKTFNLSETINSTTTDYTYTLSHIVTDKYSYFGQTISNNGENYTRTIFGKVVASSDGRDNITFDCDEHQKSYEKVGEILQFVSNVKNGCTSVNYSLENTTTYTDNFSVKSDSIITQTLLHENGTISRIWTTDYERQ